MYPDEAHYIHNRSYQNSEKSRSLHQIVFCTVSMNDDLIHGYLNLYVNFLSMTTGAMAHDWRAFSRISTDISIDRWSPSKDDIVHG